jgi:hypothetical protein
MEKKEKKFKVTYTGIPMSSFDKIIEECLEVIGWKFEGSGYDFEKDVRDLSFYKKSSSLKN